MNTVLILRFDPNFYIGVKSTVCVMPGEDYIQKNLKKKGAFEPEVTNAVVKAMAVYSGATFIGKFI